VLQALRNAVAMLALALLGVLFPLVLLEIGLRLFAPQPLAVNVSKWHPLYGWSNRPGARGFFKTSEFRMSVKIDSLGLRYREVSRARPPATFRILGLGDSFAFGHGVNTDSCFLAVAERELDARSRAAGGPRVEILNAGVGKWGTAQQYLYLTREGFSFEPDAVVVAFCIDNDFEDNESEGVLRVANGRLEPVPVPEPAVRTLQRITQAFPGYSFLSEHSHAVNFLRIKASVMEMRAHHGRPPSPEAPGARPANLPDTTITRRIFDALVEAAGEKHVPLLVLFVPGIAQCVPPGTTLPARWPDPTRHAARARQLIVHLDSLGVPNLYPLELLSEASRGRPQHFLIDGHLNERGSRLVGRALADALITGGLAPPALRPEAAATAVARSLNGRLHSAPRNGRESTFGH